MVCFFGGVNINLKLVFSLLSLILVLSVSAVSAEILNDGNSMDLMDNDEIDLNSDILNNYLSDDAPSDVISGGDVPIDNPSGDSSSDDNPFGDDSGSDDIEDTTKNTTLKIISQDDWKIFGVKNYTVKLLDEDSNPISKAKIHFKIKTPKGIFTNKTRYTDKNGIAILVLNFSLRGTYNIEVSYDGDCDYNPAESVDSNVMLYEKTIIRTSTYSYRSSHLIVRLYSTKGYYVPNKKLIISIDNVKYYRTTDSKGQAYIKMPSNKKLIKLNCTFSSLDYYEGSNRIMDLPVYKKTYTKPLVYAILKGKYFKVLLKGVDGKILSNERVKITINGKNFTKITNKKGIAYLKVSLNGDEYAVSISYGNNGVYGPSKNSTVLNVIDPSGQFKRGLNQNTKLSVSKYLSGGGYAKVTASIKRLSKKITGKYSTKLEKATAIYNYVRDNLDYEYYPNSRKGASKTLSTKSGNCCDHSNLIVALCRASNIPARYAHAQGCRFVRSGHVEGHVWAQVYVGGRWYSADGTSYRNRLGHVNNWDTKSYSRLHIYRNIPF